MTTESLQPGADSNTDPAALGFARMADAAIALFEQTRCAAKALSVAGPFIPREPVSRDKWAPALVLAAANLKDALVSFAASKPVLSSAAAISSDAKTGEDAAAPAEVVAKPDLLLQFADSVHSLLDVVALLAADSADGDAAGKADGGKSSDDSGQKIDAAKTLEKAGEATAERLIKLSDAIRSFSGEKSPFEIVATSISSNLTDKALAVSKAADVAAVMVHPRTREIVVFINLSGFRSSADEASGAEKRIPLLVNLSESAEAVRACLSEHLDTLMQSSYQIGINGHWLNDDAPLSEAADICHFAELQVRLVPYSRRTAIQHVRHLQGIIDAATLTPEVSPYGTSVLRNVQSVVRAVLESAPATDIAAAARWVKEQLNAGVERMYPSGGDYLELPTPMDMRPLRALYFSPQHPPTREAFLQMGSLCYLSAETMEGKWFGITGCAEGFYVNRSTAEVFDPSPARAPHANRRLDSLLSHVSTKFSQQFRKLTKRRFATLDQFERVTNPLPHFVWAGAAAPPVTQSALRAVEDAGALDAQTNFRDWNAEYQTGRELPVRDGVDDDQLMRDRLLFRTHVEFLDASKLAVREIVENGLQPINSWPDTVEQRCYVFRNVFAMKASDFRKQYGSLGPRAAYKVADMDLRGMAIVAAHPELKGLAPLLTAVIDYRGHRFIAQGLVHGILAQSAPMKYGTPDPPDTGLVADAEFHATLRPLADIFQFQTHRMRGLSKSIPVGGQMSDALAATEEVEYCMPVEFKGVVCADNRNYILEIGRSGPRDVLWKEYLAFHRHELAALYSKHKLEQLIMKKSKEYDDALAAEAPAALAAEGAPPASVANDATAAVEPVATAQEETEAKRVAATEATRKKNEAIKLAVADFEPVRFNPNAHCGYEVIGSADEIARQEGVVRDMCTFAREEMLPNACKALHFVYSLEDIAPTLHELGISVRHLGKIHGSIQRAPVRTLLLQEMLCRSAKLAFRARCGASGEPELRRDIAHFLSCFFGAVEAPLERKVAGVGHLFGAVGESHVDAAADEPRLRDLTSEKLWAELRADLAQHFRLTLAPEMRLRPIVDSLAVLRRFARSVGIRLVARRYALSDAVPFFEADVLDVFPVVKHAAPVSSDCQAQLNLAITYYDAGNLSWAWATASEAMNMTVQVYGMAHPDVVQCSTLLAVIAQGQGRVEESIDYLTRAVQLREVLDGPDGPLVAELYMRLASACRDADRLEEAVTFQLRGLRLALLSRMVPPNELIFALNSIARMLRQLGRVAAAHAMLHFAHNSLLSFGPRAEVRGDLTAMLMSTLSAVSVELGLFEEAMVTEARALAAVQRIFAADDEYVVQARERLRDLVRRVASDMSAVKDIAASAKRLEKLHTELSALLQPEHAALLQPLRAAADGLRTVLETFLKSRPAAEPKADKNADKNADKKTAVGRNRRRK